MRFLIAGLLLSLVAHTATAQGSWVPKSLDRANTWETSFQVIFQDDESVAGLGGSSIDFDDDTGFGFGVTYNVNNHFALGGDFNFTRPDYDAVLIDENAQAVLISNRASVFTGQLRGTYNIFAGPLTPYVEGGLGWTYIDSNVADQPPIVGCWFDPYRGYVCDTFFSTYSDTSFSYSVGAGVRWDINSEFGVRAGLSRLRLDLGSDTTADLDIGRADIYWRF
jgi:opacity protein-like surface antigen